MLEEDATDGLSPLLLWSMSVVSHELLGRGVPLLGCTLQQ